MVDNHGSAHGTTADHSAGHPAMDYAEHEKTYNLFITLTKWGLGFNHRHTRSDGDFPALTIHKRIPAATGVWPGLHRACVSEFPRH